MRVGVFPLSTDRLESAISCLESFLVVSPRRSSPFRFFFFFPAFRLFHLPSSCFFLLLSSFLPKRFHFNASTILPALKPSILVSYRTISDAFNQFFFQSFNVWFHFINSYFVSGFLHSGRDFRIHSSSMSYISLSFFSPFFHLFGKNVSFLTSRRISR